ncbi:MAG: hypothetical protein Q4D87_06720 [Actinomycetaceae bacterium]|nr:hypothetical protein [Actinomycetaceae bacterium]
MEDNELKKRMLRGKKTERVVFAASEEMKAALEIIASERCLSVSAVLTEIVLHEILKNKVLFEEAKL